MQSQAFLGNAEREQILQSEYNYLRNLNMVIIKFPLQSMHMPLRQLMRGGDFSE